ncbi:hypothetical protein ACWJKU_13260 [Methylocaldum sp. MU1018]
MRVEFELGNRLYAVRRGRRGEPVVEVYIRPHIDTGRCLHLQKPACWRPLSPRFQPTIDRVLAAARIRGLLA